MEPIVYGILFGGLLALAGIGFSLVYGVLDIVNLAHGVFIALGGYISYWLVTLLHLPEDSYPEGGERTNSLCICVDFWGVTIHSKPYDKPLDE